MSSIARQATDVKLLLNEAFSTNLDHTSYICEDNFSDFCNLIFTNYFFCLRTLLLVENIRSCNTKSCLCCFSRFEICNNVSYIKQSLSASLRKVTLHKMNIMSISLQSYRHFRSKFNYQ